MNAKDEYAFFHPIKIAVAVLLMAQISLSVAAQKPADNPVKKLGAFLGKWQTEGTFSNGGKVHSELECRWSPQHEYLICEQQVTMGAAVNRQLTVYRYAAGDTGKEVRPGAQASPPASGSSIRRNREAHSPHGRLGRLQPRRGRTRRR